MAAAGFKFRNMGNSCFINAGLQAVLALPGFASLRATTATERAVMDSRDAAAGSRAAVPRAVLDLYYRGRQEDCAEFLVEVLADCPSVHRHFRGKEQAYLACTSCDHRRALALEEFLTLQVPLLADDRPLASVQEALNNYLDREQVQEDVLEWACPNPACLQHGQLRQLPKRLTTVEDWPETLVMSLNRWDNHRGLLPHRVHVDVELRAGGDGVLYRLEAVVSHIGEQATGGHYVAYRPRSGGFTRLDDSTVSPVSYNPGDVWATEKVYVVCYARVTAAMPALVQPAIDLEEQSHMNETSAHPQTIRAETLLTAAVPALVQPAIDLEEQSHMTSAHPQTIQAEPLLIGSWIRASPAGNALFGADALPAEAPQQEERRTKLYGYDAVAAQMLEPHGESPLDKMSLEQLWKGTAKGNGKTAYHSHLAAPQETDPWHVGAGISMTAAALLAAVKHFRSSGMQNLMKADLYQKVKKEVDVLEPMLLALNFGKGSQSQKNTGSFREAKRARTTASASLEAVVVHQASLKAAAEFRTWLVQDRSPFRSLLFILSGSNSYYTGHTAEVVARAAVKCKPMSEKDFVDAVKARMQKAEAKDESGAAASDGTGLFDA